MSRFQTVTLVFALGTAAVIQRASAQNQFATLYTFGDYGPAGLAYGNGQLYGVGFFGQPADCGSVFALQPPSVAGGAWTEMVLYAFQDTLGQPCYPWGPPLAGTSGALYGITSAGGTYGFGAAYELQPPASPGGAWTETVVYNFGSSTDVIGALPEAMVQGPSGSLYVTTDIGGINPGSGALGQLIPPNVAGENWTPVLLYSFPKMGGGAAPSSNGLMLGSGGVLYGTTLEAPNGHSLGTGVVFKLIPPSVQGGAWTERVLHSFNGSGTGKAHGVTLGPGDVLYGTVSADAGRPGEVYQLTPPTSRSGSWTYTVIAKVGSNSACTATSPLMVRNGNIYGMACLTGGGVIYELQPPSVASGSWTYIPLYTFTNGQIPGGPFVMTANGVIIGATTNGNTFTPNGTVYALVTQ